MRESALSPGAGAGDADLSDQPLSVANRRMVTLAVMFGTFISLMDMTVVNVAMKHMRGTFGVDLSTITWVGSSYSIAQIIMIIMSAWWSALLGRKRFYLFSVGLFTVGSILAGTATTFNEMIIYRLIQGVGGGSLIPISQAILRESYPPRLHGTAMARFGMGVVLAPAIGPIVGGWLTEEYGWPWIFYINVPFAAVAMLMVSIYVKDPPYLKRGIQKIDWGGIALLTVGLAGLQIVLERGQEENWFESNWIASVAAVTGVVLVVLVFWELRSEEPIVDFRVLRNVPLALGSAIILVFGIAQFGTTFILPQFLQDLLGYTPYHAGMLLFPRGLTLFLAMAMVGWLYRYVDYRFFIPVGAGLIMFGMVLFSRLSLEADFWSMLPPLLLLGLGAPCVFITLTTMSLETVPAAEMTQAAAIFNLWRRMGGNIGFALLTTVLERRTAFHRISLISHVSELNEPFLRFKSGLTDTLIRQQVDPHTAQTKSLAIIDRMVDQQATMLAYNDVYVFLGWMFFAIVPLVLFFRKQKRDA
ncbi:DHA2 family efflux MFS transporter permease subunit [Nitrospinota bacterium]